MSVRKAADHRSVMQLPHLAGILLHHGLAHRDLPVANDDNLSVFADREDGGAVPLLEAMLLIFCHETGYG